MAKKEKIAVVFFNLGGPDTLKNVRPFLFNLFNDPAILGISQPFRFLLAKFISWRRAPVACEIYRHMGGGSPLLELTKAQETALKGVLEGEDVEIFTAMRYWHPMTQETVRAVKAFNPDKIILLPLYPQYSTTTTGSSLKEWHRVAKSQNLDCLTVTCCCYPVEENFIQAHVDLAHPKLEKAMQRGKTRLLLSAHGLPQKIVDAGDPYEWQVRQTADHIVAGLEEKLDNDFDWRVTFQSRVGPLKWLEPDTEQEIKKAGKEGYNLVVLPLAFVSEHSETLVELDIEYKEIAEKSGVPLYLRIPALGDHPLYMKALASIVGRVIKEGKDLSSCGETICPQSCSQCFMRREKR